MWYGDTGCQTARKYNMGATCKECGFPFCVMDVPVQTQLRDQLTETARGCFIRGVSIRKAAEELNVSKATIERHYRRFRVRV